MQAAYQPARVPAPTSTGAISTLLTLLKMLRNKTHMELSDDVDVEEYGEEGEGVGYSDDDDGEDDGDVDDVEGGEEGLTERVLAGDVECPELAACTHCHSTSLPPPSPPAMH